MSPLVIGLIAIIVFLVLSFLRVPVGFAFAIVGFIGIVIFRGFETGLYILSHIPFAWASQQTLLPVPLFILMGYFAFYSGISRDLFDACFKWFGRQAGGIAQATTVASAAFGACCGVLPAAAATMGSIAFPEMERLHYSKRLSTGCITAGATISILIPPSVPLILYGLLAEVSVARLFIGGIIPGILLAFFFLIITHTLCKRNPELGPASIISFSLKEKLISLKGVWGIIVLFAVVIGGLYAGIFTPTEAGAAGAFGAFIIAVIRRTTPFNITKAAIESARIVSLVVILIIGAMIFNTFLSLVGITPAFSQWIQQSSLSPYTFLLCTLAIYILIGMLLDIMAIILLTVPIMAPVIGNFGFDLTWFGIIIVVIAALGFITPPVGMSAFIVQGVTKVNLKDIYIGVAPYIIGMITLLILLVAFPQIVLFLPNMMK